MSQLGLFFSLLSLVMIFIQGPVMTYLSSRIREKPLIAIGSLLMFSSFMLLGNPDMLLIYASAILFALGNGVMWPSFLSLLGQLGDPADQGYIQGVASSAGSLASIFGLVGGGILYGVSGATSFVIAAMLFVCVFVLALFLPRRVITESIR